MVEIKVMIKGKPIFVLIDPGDSLSYVSPGIVEKCNLSIRKFERS